MAKVRTLYIFLIAFLFLAGCGLEQVNEFNTCADDVTQLASEALVPDKSLKESVQFQQRIKTSGMIQEEADSFQANDGMGEFECGASMYFEFDGNVDRVSGHIWDGKTFAVYSSNGEKITPDCMYVALFSNRAYETTWRFWILADGLLQKFTVDGANECVSMYELKIPAYSYCIVPISVQLESVFSQSDHFIALMYSNDISDPYAYPITVACRTPLKIDDGTGIAFTPIEYEDPIQRSKDRPQVETYFSKDEKGVEQIPIWGSLTASDEKQRLYLSVEPDKSVEMFISYVFLDNLPVEQIIWTPGEMKHVIFPIDLIITDNQTKHQLYAMHIAADPSISNSDVRVFPIMSSVYQLTVQAAP